MPEGYDPSSVEAKWQKKWEEEKVYETDLKKAKDPYYNLVMFPYPSGDKLHVGHWYNFAPADSYGRYIGMCGKHVFEPIGFDAFGLPAENYAIKTGIHPDESITTNTETMTEQLKRIGTMYDWSKTVNTSKPEYYRWTQWLFLQMFKNDLAYRKEQSVNFCPKCQTVLANEQCQDGTCERCDTEVAQQPMTQWFWKITDYAQRLLDGLEKLDWPEKTKLMQKNWIGRKHGIDITYEIEGAKRGLIGPINWAENNGPLAGDLSRRLTDEWKRRIHSPCRTVHLTFTPHKRMDVFEEETYAKAMLRILQRVADRHDIALHEVAVMPDHAHLLVSFKEGRHLEKDIEKKLKGASSREFRKIFATDSAHLWGEKHHFEEIASFDQFVAAIRYIQENPIKQNLVTDGRILSQLPETIVCFTTRPDTNFGATFVVLAPEHEFAQKVAQENKEVAAYVEKSMAKSELERQEEGRTKTGVFTGFNAINNLNGIKMPIWVSDFVLGGFGTGAVVGVPGHDMRDFEFAKEFDLPIIRVVVAPDGDTSPIEKPEQVQEDAGTMVNSDFLDGMEIMEAKEAIMDHFEKKGWGKRITTYRLRDWSISRQRYWGAPIPIVYDPEGNPHPIPEEHLPWELPKDVEFKPTGTSPLAESKELVERTEKIFGKGWTPEVDTMDTFVCSSFYQFMYLSTEGVGTKSEIRNSKSKFVDPKIEKKWMPVDMYIGGPEHACMHLIYARFVTMALKDFGFVSHNEPFQRLVHQGLITHGGAKMSKSKNNVVSPDAFIERYGSDVFRMYLMFMGPFTDGGDWNDTGIKGIDRFVQKVWKIFSNNVDPKAKEDASVTPAVHAAIKKVTEDIEKLHFNTAISALMELLNVLEKQDAVAADTAQVFAKLIAPLAPHLADELWETIGGPSSAKATEGNKGFIIEQSWPTYDAALLKTDTVVVAVQVNGKVRGELTVPTDIAEADVIAQAKEQENVQKHLEGKEIKKEIYIQGKLVSLVV